MASPSPEASSAQSGYALAKLISIEMRRFEKDEIVRKSGNRLFITNACGTAEAEFRVLDATYKASDIIRAEETIGEWCTPPFDFERNGPYFLIVQNGAVRAVWPVLYTLSGKMAIAANPAEISDIVEDLGFPADRLQVSDLSEDPIELEVHIDPSGEEIKTAVAEDESLAFAEQPGGSTILVQTNGVLLGSLFPSY